MATITELLQALSTEEAAISASDLASKLKASKEGTLKQLTREKDKGHVEGDSQEGWLITDAGRKALEKGSIHPTMLDEGVTPRQQFEAIGRRIGIKEDRIVLAADMVWSGDYEDVIWVWNALGREGADLADDLRRVWANAWRAKLHKSIPPELEAELTGIVASAVEDEHGERTKVPARDYIIIDEEPVRVGQGLGDYSLQDAKDILSIRALRERFKGTGQGAAAGAGGTAEKVSEVLTALEPYINKGSDIGTLKEILADKLALHTQDILSRIPQGNPTQPKSIIEQITDFAGAMGSLKEIGPVLRSILGVPEPSGNPTSTSFPVSVKGPDGSPVVMDLGQVIDWRRFLSEETRADERHGALMGLVQTVRENFGDGVSALKAAAEEAKRGAKAKTSIEAPPQVFECGDCHTQFSAPPGWSGQPITCPGPECGRVWTREELLGT